MRPPEVDPIPLRVDVINGWPLTVISKPLTTSDGYESLCVVSMEITYIMSPFLSWLRINKTSTALRNTTEEIYYRYRQTRRVSQ